MKDSIWPVVFFMVGIILIGIQTLRRVRTSNTTYEEKNETAKWATTFLVLAPISVVSFFLYLYQSHSWPF